MSTESSHSLPLGVYTPPIDTGLEILYQDDAILVVNKPSGLLSVPGRGSEKQDSLATRVQSRIADAMIVHRLDMCTSGIMLMARGREMQRALNRMFQERQIDKRYRALVDGELAPPEGMIDLPLITDWPNRPLQRVDHAIGKPSITHFRLLAYTLENNCSLVELTPETGRSHQLRVHMLAIGHAILGDNLYGAATSQNRADRLQLHATELAFAHPVTDALMIFQSAPPF